MNPIRLYWWRPKDKRLVNLGDAINKIVVEDVSGRSVDWADLVNCDLLAIGSVLSFPFEKKVFDQRASPIHVWGSGLVEAMKIEGRGNFVYAAVRGPLTRSMLGNSHRLPLGDPGLLASQIWTRRQPGAHALGIIPHHSQLGSPYVQSLLEANPGAKLLNFTDPDIAGTLATLASCERIVSSSLHGLIIADSYGIPNAWLSEESVHRGQNWKFFDYFSSVGRVNFTPMDLSGGYRIVADDVAFEQDHFPRVQALAARLRACFPAVG